MATPTTTQEETRTQQRTRLRRSDPVHGEILDFLDNENALLNGDRLYEWLELLATDVSYLMPSRETVYRKDGDEWDMEGAHWEAYFRDTKEMLELRVKRSIEIASAYDRDPLPRVRRFVTNVVVESSDVDNEFVVTSNVLALRNRFDDTTYDLLSADREDVVRGTSLGFELARRLIRVDQARLDSPWVNVFL